MNVNLKPTYRALTQNIISLNIALITIKIKNNITNEKNG